MKIAIFTEDLPPSLGGIAQWAGGVARSFSAQGHSVTIYMRKRPLRGSQLHDNEVYHVIPMQDWKWTQFRSLYIAWYMIRALLIGPQLIIATAWNIGAFSALLSRFLSHKTMIIYHGLEVTKKLSTKRLLKLRHTLERATYNIAVSKFTAEAIHSKFQSLKNLHVVQNGIDPKRFYPEPKPQRLVNQYHLVDKKVIMTLARVIERKGHDTVIRAMAELIKTEPQLIYLIAGGFDAEYRKRLEKLISESGLEKSVIFSGYIPDVEILDYYNLCDIYIMVSKDSNEKGDTEGFGITYLEANACEKPVIGSNLHGIPDAIEDGVSGFLIEADDHLVLIEIVQKLLAKPEYARQIGKQGRQRVLNGFTWDIVTKELLAIVENE